MFLKDNWHITIYEKQLDIRKLSLILKLEKETSAPNIKKVNFSKKWKTEKEKRKF
jgi:hypothetical protein